MASWISMDEACRLLGVRPQTIYAYVSRGLLASEPGPGPSRARRYPRAPVEALIARREKSRDRELAAHGQLHWGLPVLDSELTLIQDGIAHGVVHDARSAALAGTRSTGHALAPGGVPTGPRPTNLVLLGGDAEGEGALAAPIERGLLVPSFATLDLLEPGTARIGGRTRGAVLIENGVASRPACDVVVVDDALRILMATEELGAVERLVLRSDGSGVVCPPLRAAGVPVAA